MKIKKIYFPLVLFIFLLALCSCKKEEITKNGASITFYLNGGSCQNNAKDYIINYYDHITEGVESKIADPASFHDNKIQRSGYKLEGWYKNSELTQKWNFTTDKVGHDGVTLYAKWVPDVVYTFELYDFGDKTRKIADYTVEAAGSVFPEVNKSADKWKKEIRKFGYTCIGFVDEQGKTGSEIVHPGGETSTSVKVYAKYIEGTYSLVSTAAQLKANKSNNIYLLEDIDLGGDKFSFSDYKGKTFLGNGHIIKNFTVEANYGNLEEDFEGNNTPGNVYVSLFHSLESSTIQDVTFEDVTFSIPNSTYSKIQSVHFAPFTAKLVTSKLENVTISGTLNCAMKKPCELVTDRLYYYQPDNDSSTMTNCSVDVVTNNN